jgi:hypothetical protein
MIFAILFTLAFAALKRYKLKPLVKAYALYPFALLTLVTVYLQVCVFLHDYRWIKYASYIKTAYLISLLIPFLVYKLYKPGLVGAGLIILGSALNKFVIWQNGGQMPVYATFSRLTGYYSETAIQTADTLHSVGGPMTKYKILTDFIDIGYSVLSIGDLFIHSFVVIILFYVIKELNRKPDIAQTV